MAESKKLVWDPVGERTYEAGVEQVALYPQGSTGAYETGVAWNGATNVTLSPSGAEPTKLYANNKVYLTIMSAEELGVSISAYESPPEFDECDGSKSIMKGFSAKQQPRKPFGLAFKTLVGNDTEHTAYGYKIHLVYGILASPSERAYASVNESTEPIEMSWDGSTTPVEIPGFKSSASLEFDSMNFSKENMKKLEDIIYGSESKEARLPLPSELIELFNITNDDSGENPEG